MRRQSLQDVLEVGERIDLMALAITNRLTTAQAA